VVRIVPFLVIPRSIAMFRPKLGFGQRSEELSRFFRRRVLPRLGQVTIGRLAPGSRDKQAAPKCGTALCWKIRGTHHSAAGVGASDSSCTFGKFATVILDAKPIRRIIDCLHRTGKLILQWVARRTSLLCSLKIKEMIMPGIVSEGSG
jgi:hypothetical protein